MIFIPDPPAETLPISDISSTTNMEIILKESKYWFILLHDTELHEIMSLSLDIRFERHISENL